MCLFAPIDEAIKNGLELIILGRATRHSHTRLKNFIKLYNRANDMHMYEIISIFDY